MKFTNMEVKATAKRLDRHHGDFNNALDTLRVEHSGVKELARESVREAGRMLSRAGVNRERGVFAAPSLSEAGSAV